MVLRGQFLERPTLIPVQGLILEGLSHRGTRAPGVLILPPPAQQGGSMDHVLAAEVAFACAIAGHPTLRFNYRGVGASQGERDGEQAHQEDAAAALTLLQENIGGIGRPVAVVALGGAYPVALALSQVPGVCGLLLVDASLPQGWTAPLPYCTLESDPQNPAPLGRAVVRWLEIRLAQVESL